MRLLCLLVLSTAFLSLAPAGLRAQEIDSPSSLKPSLYAGGGIGFYSNEGKRNPGYQADAGTDLALRKYFAEFEVGVDTVNASDSPDGHIFRAHGLLFYNIKREWRVGGGIHYADFKTNAYSKADLWPTAALMYSTRYFRANIQYLLPGHNADYRTTGPLADFRVPVWKSLYGRARLGIFHFDDKLIYPYKSEWGSEATFGVLWVFGEKR